MRLQEVEKGDSFFKENLFRFISLVSGMRLPDAARIVMYHRDFYGQPMTAWTHAAMRGESDWTVGERELMAAMVAKWNTCPFCIDAHGSIAALELGKPLVTHSLNDFQQAGISKKLQATISFLNKLIASPDDVSVTDVRKVLSQEVTIEALQDAIAVTALFSMTVRCANTLNFTLLNDRDSSRAAKRMLKHGYVSGRKNNAGNADHRSFAETLRKRVLEGTGKTDPALRQAFAKQMKGESSIEEPYLTLALQIRDASYKITGDLIKKIVIKSGSEKAAFELVTTACVIAGLYYWDKGIGLLKNKP